jgi:hypothetical protein
VNDVAVDTLAVGTLVRSIAAGDGGNAPLGTGGNGGSVNGVHTSSDIGVRSGVNFGYATMGGIFAGAGGTGVKQGAAGNVTDITASAIAAIVAGKGAAPQLVTKVDGIILTGNQSTKVNPDGSFINFNVANLVGAVVNPNSAGANTFGVGHFVDSNNNNTFELGEIPFDGLIAAITLTNNRNFVPEAYLFASGPNGFFDYKNGL